MRRDEETQLTTASDIETPRVEIVPALTLVAHSDPARVGDRLPLPSLAAGQEVALARLEPVFQHPRTLEAAALGDRSISRQPIRLIPIDDGIAVDPSTTRTSVSFGGARIEERRLFAAEDIDRGVVLQVGRRVVLLLHRMPFDGPWATGPRAGAASPDGGATSLIGESAGLVRLRQEIRQLASLDLPILLRGETGTGKELVARALHDSGARRGGPFVAINMAAVPPTLAASELFGATRGAYTGAAREKVGLFEHAEGGTLFLDEIGETPSEVQPMLLRALESNEILPVGAVEPRKIDVRVVAATDARLGEAVAAGEFRAPLLHRLSGYSIHLPTLAQRRDDIGRLLYYFLDQELEKLGGPALGEHANPPWPPAEVVALLAAGDWPGNVRQLRNIARWLAAVGRDLPTHELVARLEEIPEGPGAGTARASEAVTTRATHTPTDGVGPSRRRKLRKPSDVAEEELLTALRDNRFELTSTAEALGVSRANLYRLIDDSPAVRKAVDLSRDEIENALARCGDDLRATAAELEVSLRGLKRRMTELDLGRD